MFTIGLREMLFWRFQLEFKGPIIDPSNDQKKMSAEYRVGCLMKLGFETQMFYVRNGAG